MKITRSKGGVIKMTANNKKDSLQLLEFLENAAGRGDDPERKSIKKRAQLEIIAGDVVRTIIKDSEATFLEFEVIEIKEFNFNRMALSERYGWINVDLLILSKEANSEN